MVGFGLTLLLSVAAARPAELQLVHSMSELFRGLRLAVQQKDVCAYAHGRGWYEAVRHLFPRFADGAQHDAHDFLGQITVRLHTELATVRVNRSPTSLTLAPPGTNAVLQSNSSVSAPTGEEEMSSSGWTGLMWVTCYPLTFTS